MSKNFFFESKGPFKLNILFPDHSTSKTNIKDVKTLDKAGKLVTHLVKYYGLKVSSARNAVADLVRFL